MQSLFPLPFTCLHETYVADAEDDHGNPVPDWNAPVSVDCYWQPAGSAEPASPPTGGDRVLVDLELVVDSALAVDHRDVFTVQTMKFEVIGLPGDWDHGPFGFVPGRRVIELKWRG